MPFQAKPIAFGQTPKPGEAAPRLSVAKMNRRFAALAEAREILTHLPGPGEELHAIMSGRYDLTDLLEVIIEKLGPVDHMRIATLSFNRHNLNLLSNWCASRQVGRLTILYSLFFREHNPEIVEEMRRLIPDARTAAARNHCKVVTMDYPGRKLSLEGSANLRTNSNWEQMTLIDSPDLWSFHSAWIDEEVTKHAPK